jgi:hypothetical protein
VSSKHFFPQRMGLPDKDLDASTPSTCPLLDATSRKPNSNVSILGAARIISDSQLLLGEARTVDLRKRCILISRCNMDSGYFQTTVTGERIPSALWVKGFPMINFCWGGSSFHHM